MVNDVEGARSRGGRGALSSMRGGISVCVAMVVVLIVAMGMVV